MKKEYAEPKVKVMNIGCSSMLCASDTETDTLEVHNEYYDGPAY